MHVRNKIGESARETGVIGLVFKDYMMNKSTKIEIDCKNMMLWISALSAATWTHLFSISAGFVSLSTKQANQDDLYKWFIFI